MTRAVLSIGSNLGDRAAILNRARAAFAPWLIAQSAVYETAPWGPVPQDDFLNAVLVVEDATASAGAWLERAHAAEQDAGRERLERWGPRSLDVDVVAVWDGDQAVISDDPALTLPHPRAAERAFVLVPWLDADPQAELPGRGPVTGLVAALCDGADGADGEDGADGVRRWGTLSGGGA